MAKARTAAPERTPVSTAPSVDASAPVATPTPSLKRPLDEAKVAQIRGAVLRYGSINPSRFQVAFYSFSKKERKERGLHGLAHFDPLDGSINVEVPEIEKIRNDECLAFVFLHELAHYDGVHDEEEATNLAVESLKEANILSEGRTNDLRRLWKLANDSEVLTTEADSILARAGRDPKRLSVEDLEEVVDEVSTNLLCGTA